MKRFVWLGVVILMIALLGACGGTVSQPEPATEAPAADEPAAEEPAQEEATTTEETSAEAPAAEADSEAKYQIPNIEEGKYNVAFVHVGPHDDGGWTQSHEIGRQYVEDNVDNVHTAYVENVAEGADSEQVIRSLARKGFDVIFATSFGFMDASEIVAEEFPETDIIHISGFKSNEANFGNLYGAMEDMKYLAGMIAGSRAKMDGNPKVGTILTFPLAEQIRHGNAFALGVQETCPECTVDIRWILTWHDPIVEREAAASLFDAGAQGVTSTLATAPLTHVSPLPTGIGALFTPTSSNDRVRAPGQVAGITLMPIAGRWKSSGLWKGKRCVLA